MAASRTFDASKAWENPNIVIPIEKAHLTTSKADTSQLYEKLCVKHDQVQMVSKGETQDSIEMDQTMIEHLCEKPILEWDASSLQQLTMGMQDPEKKSSYQLYLQSRPHKEEIHKIKELMLESIKTNQNANLMASKSNPFHRSQSFGLVSLLSENSRHDAQLAYYAKVIENIKQPDGEQEPEQ